MLKLSTSGSISELAYLAIGLIIAAFALGYALYSANIIVNFSNQELLIHSINPHVIAYCKQDKIMKDSCSINNLVIVITNIGRTRFIIKQIELVSSSKHVTKNLHLELQPGDYSVIHGDDIGKDLTLSKDSILILKICSDEKTNLCKLYQTKVLIIKFIQPKPPNVIVKELMYRKHIIIAFVPEDLRNYTVGYVTRDYRVIPLPTYYRGSYDIVIAEYKGGSKCKCRCYGNNHCYCNRACIDKSSETKIKSLVVVYPVEYGNCIKSINITSNNIITIEHYCSSTKLNLP